MDPQATLDAIVALFRKRSGATQFEVYSEAHELLTAYREWRGKGGFEPPRGDARARAFTWKLERLAQRIRERCEAAVKGPGKFEGEEPWVFLAWEEIVMSGAAEEITLDASEDGEAGTTYSIVAFEAEWRSLFPELVEEPRELALHERSDGFVCSDDAEMVRDAARAEEDDREANDLAHE